MSIVADQLMLHPDWSAESIAESVLAVCSDAERDTFALTAIRNDVGFLRRKAALEVERSATTAKKESRPPAVSVEDLKTAFKEDRERRAREREENQAALAAARMSVGAFAAAVLTEVRLELTEELLQTRFSLGDGRDVTWESATVEDHAARIVLQAGNLAAVAEDVERHQQAISQINAGGVSCLGELICSAAA